MKTPWIVCHDGRKGDMAYALECKRCGMTQKIATPISVDCWVAMGKAFAEQHRRCQLKALKSETEDRQ